MTDTFHSFLYVSLRIRPAEYIRIRLQAQDSDKNLRKGVPMNIFIPLLTLTLLAARVPWAESKSVTFFSDGAIVEVEATATKGSIEMALPATLIEGSLRIRPGSGTSLQRVQILSTALDSSKGEKELDALLEQRNRLGDRLQALETREEIFKSAAKSQSGKAPRKTKANPDPMLTIRQGTEFAIAQLEAVYTARRKTEQDIKRIDSRIAAAKKSGRGPETVVRVHVSPARGRVTARYAIADLGWTPRYDMYLDGSNSAQVYLSGLFNGAFAGYLLQASPATLAERDTARVFPVNPDQSARLTSFRLPVSETQFGTGIRSSFSYTLKNSERLHLPGGDASIYKNGEYVGRFRFEGISSGRSKAISVGM
jgi:hypothetical protein